MNSPYKRRRAEHGDKSKTGNKKAGVFQKKRKFPTKPSQPAGPLFPMRINRYLAHKGYSTRRGADELIQKRWVTINGKIAVLGDKVSETDHVEVRNNKRPDEYVYYAYNKPKGTPIEKVNVPRELVPVLSLDTPSEGLVIFTNDRRIIDRLANPQHKHEKEYSVKTIAPIKPNFKEKMEQGITLAGSEPILNKVKIRDEKAFMLRITDSGTHIRQMCSLFQTEIESLKRIRILNIELGPVESGSHRQIEGEELAAFLQTLGL